MADAAIRGLPGKKESPAPEAARAGTFAWIAASAAMLVVLAGPALWNGFPIIFPDTGGYLTRPLEGTLDIGRSALYGLFLLAGMPLSFWPVIFVQAAATAWLILLVVRVQGFALRPWLALAVVTAMSLLSSLPWLAGQLLPDILFPLAVLALYLLAYADKALARWERYALAGVIVFAIASHMAAAGLCIGLLAITWVLGCASRFRLPKSRLAFAAAAIAAGLLLGPVSNWAISGTFVFTPGGVSFIFGRLIEDGIVGRYLNDRCPDPAIRLCAYKDSMPENSDEWLWNPDSPYRKLHGWRGVGDEERRIIFDTISRYPLMHLRAAAADTLEQLTSFQTEVSLDDNAPTIEALQQWAPQLVPALMRTRQQTRAIDVDAINRVHVPAAALAMLALAGAVVFRRGLKLSPQAAAFGITVLASLFINAAICAVFAHAVDRYQSRLAPLALLAVAIVALGLWRDTRLGDRRHLS